MDRYNYDAVPAPDAFRHAGHAKQLTQDDWRLIAKKSEEAGLDPAHVSTVMDGLVAHDNSAHLTPDAVLKVAATLIDAGQKAKEAGVYPADVMHALSTFVQVKGADFQIAALPQAGEDLIAVAQKAQAARVEPWNVLAKIEGEMVNRSEQQPFQLPEIPQLGQQIVSGAAARIARREAIERQVKDMQPSSQLPVAGREIDSNVVARQ